MFKKNWDNFRQVRKALIHDDSIRQQHIDKGKRLPLKFSVLVWNTFKRHGALEFDSDLLDLHACSDLFCFQEVLYGEELFLPSEFNRLNYNYAISYLRRDGYCEGILTASEYPQLSEAHSLLSIAREPVTKTPKASLITVFPLSDGRNLLFINIHMLLFKRKKTMQRELQQVLDHTRQYHDCPAVFAGDFNTFTARQREQVDIILAEDGYDRCFPHHEPRGKRYLDHIYVRGMRKTDVEILDNIESSDHYPLYCQLEVQP